MMKFSHILLVTAAAATLSACATTAPGPVEVTRFHQPAALAQLGQGTIFVDTAPGQDASSLELAPYKEAVARQLVRLGYREAPRDQAGQIAQVSLDRFTAEPEPKRNPVSVGVGGSTGSYGSGMGLGIGINLGGKKSGPEVATQLAVSIRSAATGEALWEGRGNFAVSNTSPLANSSANAATIAEAMFREFPGNNGETTEVKVSK